jgi:uncharacterized lipoprotein YajG
LFIDGPRTTGHEDAMRALLLLPASLMLSACYRVAMTAVDVVTLPVKAVSAGVDAATTSQSEADEKRGRELRKAEEEAGKRQRLWAEACRKAQARGEPCPPPQTRD